MLLNKRERNRLFQVIVEEKFDPAEFELDDNGDKVTVTHNSGSVFEVSVKPRDDTFFEKFQIDDSGLEYKFTVAEGNSKTGSATNDISFVSRYYVPDWLKEIRLTVGMPDYWEELKRGQESIAVIRREDFENTPFAEDEQRQISAQLREIKNQLEKFQLPSKQMSQVEQRLDKLEEASHHLGRKDWLIMAITTVSPLVVSDIMPPGLTRHVFTFIINGLIHLFGGGPPQILA
jgi:hypothetical protein